MKVQVSDWTDTQKRVVVEIPAEKVQPEIDKRYRSIAKSARIKGFRPGKAPVSLIKSLYGGIIQEEIAQKLIEETFHDALESQQLKPIAQSDLEEFHYTEDGDLVYTVIVYVAPEFEISTYKGMEIKVPKQQKSIDELVVEELEHIRKEQANYVSTNESLSEGLLAICDIRRIDTQQVEGELGKENLEGIEIEIGSGKFHSDVERQMVGMKPGEKWILEFSFGKNAPVPEWTDQTVKLEIYLKDVMKIELPEVDDELAKAVGYSSLEELKQELRKRIEERRERERRYLVEVQLKSKLLEAHDFQLPEKAIQRVIEEKINNIDLQLRRQGLKIPDNFLRSEESRDRIRPEAEVDLKYELILDRIAQQEGIDLTEAEEQEIVDLIVKTMGETEEAHDFSKNPYFKRLRQYKLHEKVVDWLVKNTVIIEESESVSQEETHKTLENEKA
ncbi:MAG: trigger factor [Syntrophobacterales bacterium]|nr:trigger factor [Syntrophobacterales bacterium]